ncbi:MAG: SWIM zinc finger family protein [Phormidesmis sp.]
MSNFTRTWWGQSFLTALETFTDSGRLSRGRSYANGKKVKSFEIDSGHVTAEVRGSINPYYGVYSEPLYSTELEFKTISRAKWAAVIALMASKVSTLSRLLVGEMPDDIEESFETLGLSLLPRERGDFKSHCSCPDWSNPCKHIAGVYYLVAAELDKDPLKLFELRGLSRKDLNSELAKTPLGMALAAELTAESRPIEIAESLYTRPQTQPIGKASLENFWQGKKRLPTTVEDSQPTSVSAILVKKQGDFPPFWDRDNSFIEAMEEFYDRVRAKNGDILD